jgi:hypothetical protein
MRYSLLLPEFHWVWPDTVPPAAVQEQLAVAKVGRRARRRRRAHLISIGTMPPWKTLPSTVF